MPYRGSENLFFKIAPGNQGLLRRCSSWYLIFAAGIRFRGTKWLALLRRACRSDVSEQIIIPIWGSRIDPGAFSVLLATRQDRA